MIFLLSLCRSSAISIIISLSIVALTTRLFRFLSQFSKVSKVSSRDQISTLVYWGSGGHTTEMIRLIRNLSASKYRPLLFTLSNSDRTSEDKINSANLAREREVVWKTVYRSREVKQSWLSTIFTTLLCTLDCFLLIWRFRPGLILCNGPGTCVPICYCAFMMRLLGIYTPKIVYVESFCRVKSLSLSGKLIYPIADKFIVQWPELTRLYDKAVYIGRVC